MDTQNTPIHIKLWHRDFWLMAIANLLMMASIYALIPLLPTYLLAQGFSSLEVGAMVGVYGIGIFALGGWCSFFVQHYRRNRVCQYAVLAIIACFAVTYYIDNFLSVTLEFWMLLCLRLCLGAFLGLAQMTLCSTLIIDTCESFQRTEANHAAAWFSRFGLSLGPVLSIVVFRHFDYEGGFILSCLLTVASLILISMVSFPFKAPADQLPKLSLDRFFLPQGMMLFVNLALAMFAVGLLLSHVQSERFYAMMMLGFFFALLSEKFVFANADLRSEVPCGLILLFAANLILYTQHTTATAYIAPALIGFGVGIIGSRFLLFFIKLAKHCQRGTSQSTFFLAWEMGLSLGVGAGYMLSVPLQHVSLCLMVICFLFYNFIVHPWYLKNKNR